MSKDKNKKTRCIKKYRYSAKEVAALSGVSESYVKQIRVKPADFKSQKSQVVFQIDKLLYDGSIELLEKAKKLNAL